MAKKKRSTKDFDSKLLVEGKDDQHVIWALCERFKIKETFNIIALEGIDNLMEDLWVRPQQANLASLGIIVDADTDIKMRWDQLRKRLEKSGYSIPNKPALEGTIVTANRLPTLGIWLMPNNQLPGMIEDFIRFLVPENEESLALAEEIITTLEERNLQQYIPNHRAKALIHTWLAWQEDPGTPLGQAITKRYLTIDTTIATQLVQWLNSLFNP